MRIFLTIPGSPNAAFESSLWRANLHDPLVEMGHDVVLFEDGVQPLFDFDPDDPATAPRRTAFGSSLMRAADDAHAAKPLDLVLTYLSDSHVDSQTIRRISDRTAPIVNFFCNNVHQFHLVKRTAPYYAACLVPEKAAIDHYRDVDAKPIWFPMAANPATYRPLKVQPQYDVTFAGQRYADRTTAMLTLREAGIDAHAFGQGWDVLGPAGETKPADAPSGGPKGVGDELQDVAREAAEALEKSVPAAKEAFAAAGRLAEGVLRGRDPVRAIRDRRDWQQLREHHPHALHGTLDDSEYVGLFSLSRINLGFLVLGDTHRTSRPLRQIRLREFEGPMAGAFYMTGWLDELAEHYEIGKEIVCYRSHEELVDLCRHYLKHDDERERIRKAGHARAVRDHTWQRRFETLFKELGRRGVIEA